ncbi:hypothetical protein [uncultured Algoriphagus sp.]|uniref:hypothetical protein n=1 Tax=uncultured Algoriphagus sp. TaxID=417365 RepID=UPI0030EEA047
MEAKLLVCHFEVKGLEGRGSAWPALHRKVGLDGIAGNSRQFTRLLASVAFEMAS